MTMVTKIATGKPARVSQPVGATEAPQGRRGRKPKPEVEGTSSEGAEWASREVPQEELETGRQRMKLKCMTVNVPENVMTMLQIHADRRLDTLTTVIREALVKYLRETPMPEPIDFSLTER